MDINAKKSIVASTHPQQARGTAGAGIRSRLPVLLQISLGCMALFGAIGSAQAALSSLVTEPSLLPDEGPMARVSSHSARSGRDFALSHHHIVPETLHDGLVLNLAQRMLYFFRGGQLAAAYPVAVGKADWRTPMGPFRVTNLQMNKTWHIPKSIQEEMRNEGQIVKTSVPPGPKNPLGKYWIGVSLPGIGIHGTIAPSSIYHFASHGCVRLNPHDIEALYSQVHVGIHGNAMYKPVLMAKTSEGRIYVEANPDPYHKGPANPLQYLQSEAAASHIADAVDWQAVKKVLARRDGAAHEVGKGAANTFYAYEEPAPVHVKAHRNRGSRPEMVAGERGAASMPIIDFSMRPYGPDNQGGYASRAAVGSSSMPVIQWPRP